MNTPNPDHSIAIQEALFAGNKIQAIKLYREQTGVGLKEAKDAVEKMEADLRTSAQDRFANPQAKGCFTVIVGLGFMGAAVWRLIG